MGTKDTESIALRPLIALASDLPESDLEILTVEAIVEYRKRAAYADELCDALRHKHGALKKNGGEKHREFVAAMLKVHTQMAVVAALTDVLGYVPAVDDT